ncbi:hypothetical protein [Cellulomonas hominis]
MLTMLGIPVALFMASTGFVSRVSGGSLRRGRVGPAPQQLPDRHFADYGSEYQRWTRELMRREQE